MEELLVFLELLGTAAFAVSGAMTALLLGSTVVMVIRFLAAHFRWSLPRPRYRKKKKTSVLQTEVFSAYQKKPRRVCRPQAAKK
ncbi:hypothetical protein [Vescimonas sp.]|uniref:hypothetical protein n=1 Tax=Vescimonas sp. TaxID=2892404 RepID=UPI00307AA2C0